MWLVAAATLVVDQASKWWALRELQPGERRPLIGDLISLRLIRNPGAAFSALDTMTYVVTLIAVAIVAYIAVYAHRRRLPRAAALGLGLVAGGALGNLVDRFAREPGFLRGHVVDFIDYFGWFVGNVADIAIVLAVVAFLVVSLRGGERNQPGGERNE